MTGSLQFLRELRWRHIDLYNVRMALFSDGEKLNFHLIRTFRRLEGDVFLSPSEM